MSALHEGTSGDPVFMDATAVRRALLRRSSMQNLALSRTGFLAVGSALFLLGCCPLYFR